jgi:hypothetical protein
VIVPNLSQLFVLFKQRISQFLALIINVLYDSPSKYIRTRRDYNHHTSSTNQGRLLIYMEDHTSSSAAASLPKLAPKPAKSDKKRMASGSPQASPPQLGELPESVPQGSVASPDPLSVSFLLNNEISNAETQRRSGHKEQLADPDEEVWYCCKCLRLIREEWTPIFNVLSEGKCGQNSRQANGRRRYCHHERCQEGCVILRAKDELPLWNYRHGHAMTKVPWAHGLSEWTYEHFRRLLQPSQHPPWYCCQCAKNRFKKFNEPNEAYKCEHKQGDHRCNHRPCPECRSSQFPLEAIGSRRFCCKCYKRDHPSMLEPVTTETCDRTYFENGEQKICGHVECDTCEHDLKPWRSGPPRKAVDTDSTA